MSSANDGRRAAMDSTQVSRGDFYRSQGRSIRRMTPVNADGGADGSRPVIYRQVQVMTPMVRCRSVSSWKPPPERGDREIDGNRRRQQGT